MFLFLCGYDTTDLWDLGWRVDDCQLVKLKCPNDLVMQLGRHDHHGGVDVFTSIISQITMTWHAPSQSFYHRQ